MGIEEDLANMFKNVNFSSMANPAGMLKMMQLSILKQMKTVIDNQIKKMSKEDAKVAHMDLDPYKILGVDINATWEDIEKAYKVKAAEHHPDKGGDNMEMVKINAAYEVFKKIMGGGE